MVEGKNLRLSALLTQWYEKNKRELPWRETNDPYIIWISEIILQQTRVDQGWAYFDRFIYRFPDVSSLAVADEGEVLKLWQGLGYYSRARNLHATAQIIAGIYKGVFPREYKDVLALKGIGEYTAAAIVSFAYNQPYAVVDGNVYRVLSRIFAVDDAIDTTSGKKVFAQLAQSLLNEEEPGLHNQAIMEFGALQCVPMSPNCQICPMADFCQAYLYNKVSSYPVKEGKTKVRNRYFNYLDIRHNDKMYLNKRGAKDIWHGLYELPLIETSESLSIERLQKDESFVKLFDNVEGVTITLVSQMKHVLSHQIIYANFYRIEIERGDFPDYLQIEAETVDDYPVSRLVEKYLLSD
ncbi:A/G-specific adenine glycosylase [Dysgonomonas sp. ZJ279]|uniref:A/G-specific adenine glycosylase n=1 Tax=Dysgonomonas sp. ZJ279 TaxID=2709796 RepID=UPI0013EC774A|nr:A/G-specific adenine glycosylase [Dysgonomonas sp. ZJ279]